MGSILASLGGFFKLRGKGILIIVIGILIILGIWHYNSLIEDKVKAMIGYQQVQQTLQEQKEAFNKLENQYNLVIRLNEKYREEIRKIRKDMVEVSDDIEKLEEQNEKVAEWTNNTIPVPVLDRLREQGSENSN